LLKNVKILFYFGGLMFYIEKRITTLS